VIYDCTPRLARSLLDHLHPGQRSYDDAKAEYWAKVLAGTGEVFWNPELAFVEIRDINLKVTDGQHHLAAIANCALPVVQVSLVPWPVSTFRESRSEAVNAKVKTFVDSLPR
jgi:hypothetical protein